MGHSSETKGGTADKFTYLKTKHPTLAKQNKVRINMSKFKIVAIPLIDWECEGWVWDHPQLLGSCEPPELYLTHQSSLSRLHPLPSSSI
jgi:hypothetical protein